MPHALKACSELSIYFGGNNVFPSFKSISALSLRIAVGLYLAVDL